MSAAMAAAEHRIERTFAGDGGNRLHTVKFERNRLSGLWRAHCSCGWSTVGTEDQAKASAAGHDEWEPVA